MLDLFKNYSKLSASSCVYEIVTTYNNKSYVGSTLSFRKRMKDHRNLLKANKHHNPRLQNVYNKHGESCFKVKVLKMHNGIFKLNSKEHVELIKDEEYYINSLNAEYNVMKTPTTQTNNPSTSKKVYQYDLQGNFVKEWISVRDVNRNINIQVKVGKNRSAGGYQWSFIKKDKLCPYKASQGFNVTISVYSLGGSKIETYPSITVCTEKLFPNHNFKSAYQSITHSLKTSKPFTGLRFKYGEDERLDNSKCRDHKKGYIISQYDLNMTLIKHWSNTAEAEEKLNLKGIYDNIIGKTKTCGGYKWKKL